MKSENILVIGGTGKTGSRVARNLTKLGHNVRVVGRKTAPSFDWENTDTYDVNDEKDAVIEPDSLTESSNSDSDDPKESKPA